jgi:phage gpG-like protein
MAGQAFKLIQDSKELQQALKDSVTIMGVEAINHFTKSFRNQGFEDVTVQRWQPRKRNTDPGRGILIGKGTAILRKSLIKRNIGRYAVMITSPLDYANVHNEGLRAGRGKGFKMPKRQFVGDSQKLMNKIERMIDRRIMSAWK